MNFLKILGKSFLYIVAILLISTFLVTLLNYIGFFGPKLTTTFKIMIPIISLFIGGLIVGKNSHKKGWLEGLKLGLVFIIILFIFNYLGLNYKFNTRTLVYNIILVITAIFGSMIGINYKKEPKNP